MKGSEAVAVTIAVIAWIVVPLAAQADNCSGRFNNVGTHAETIEVAKGHAVISFALRSSATSENSIFNAVGGCAGYALAMPDGKLRLIGVCARKNKDGNSYSDEWGFEPGAPRGWWKIAAGTGVYAAMIGTSGWAAGDRGQREGDDGKLGV